MTTNSGSTSQHIAPPGRSDRTLLTALCYDLVGSTDIFAHSDPEDYYELVVAFRRNVRSAIAARGGSIMHEAGDGGLAIFPVDIDARDAASAAIHTGLEIIASCKRLSLERRRSDLHVRIGVATSMALVQGTESVPAPDHVVAIAMPMATRLEAIAGSDTLLVCEQTRRLAGRSHSFQYLGTFDLKGFDKPESVWKVLNRHLVVDRFFAFGRLSARMVGRVAELDAINQCWELAASGQGRIVLIEGEAGIGKSRLLHEFRRLIRTQRKKMLLFQCLPGGSHSTLHPIAQSLPSIEGTPSGGSSVASVANFFKIHGIHDPDVIDVFSFLLGVDSSNISQLRDASPDVVQQRLAWTVRRSVELLCAAGPVLVAIEDFHWIDPTSEQLLAAAAQIVQQYPLLLLVTSRTAVERQWAQKSSLTHVQLRRFSSEEMLSAIDTMWPHDKPPADSGLLDLIGRITGGNPFLVEEISQWIAENPDSANDQFSAAVSPSAFSTLESVIDARLKPLRRARDVARAASVIGLRFNVALLREMLPDLDESALLEALARLNDLGFLGPVRSAGTTLYSFRHALIQETVYRGLLRKTRQAHHAQIFNAVSRSPDVATWIDASALAEHAESAGLIPEAVRFLIAAGKDRSARSATTEARQLLERALKLCVQLVEPDQQVTLKLSAIATLGPILTAVEGSGSEAARRLYEDAIAAARSRPASERAALFPIYWGWWFTGSDLDNERARQILHELKNVDDPEVQLQVRHCVWAIDFYLGRHESCVAAVNAAMLLYDADRGRESITLYGGHDAKVCGLSHRSLSEWLTGKAGRATRSMAEARNWAQQIGHIGSIAHSYHNQAMLHCYRRDFSALADVIAEFRKVAEKHTFPSLSATMQIFEGWCEGNAGQIKRGQQKIQQGLAVHAELQTPEDYPVYCTLLAELMAHTGEFESALNLLSNAEIEAEKSGHRYWLAALYHRRARLLVEQDAAPGAVVAALAKALELAKQQNAVPLLLDAYGSLTSLGLSRELADSYRACAQAAQATLEDGEDLVVSVEPDIGGHSISCRSMR